MTAERETLAEVLAPAVYEAYRLGKYGTEDYLPMWHEKPPAEHAVPRPEVDAAATAALAWLTTELDSPEMVEAVAERLSWDGGEFTRWRDGAHPDHNRWSWRGDGHGEVLREVYRQQAAAALAVIRERVGGGG